MLKRRGGRGIGRARDISEVPPGGTLFAKDLEYLLAECCGQSDVSRIDPTDIPHRFDSLRGYGRLPRGRENRPKRLAPTEIAAAILGLVPSNPKWAGHAAIILNDLRPVGGLGASFNGPINLTAAVERLLTDSRRAKRLSLPHALRCRERY